MEIHGRVAVVTGSGGPGFGRAVESRKTVDLKTIEISQTE